jgi:hypothetical protein
VRELRDRHKKKIKKTLDTAGVVRDTALTRWDEKAGFQMG